MGMIYRPKYTKPDGTRAESAVYWIKYYRDGQAIRENAKTTNPAEARKFLKAQEGKVAQGLPLTPQVGRVTYEELREIVITDYVNNEQSSVGDARRRFKLHLDPFFRGRRAGSIGADDAAKYIKARKSKGAANATINRELSLLARGFALAKERGKLLFEPTIRQLEENNTRTGFFEADKFEGVRRRLRPALQPVVTFAYLTGWRVQSEVLPLQWRQVDFKAGNVTLDVGTTKNREGRVFPLTAELRTLLEAQRAHTEAVQRERGEIIPHVFHRKGKRISGFRRAWASACRDAGCPGMILHDFRRTAVRNLVRAGIVEAVAMKMTGHKTRSVFERYNIVSEGDLAAAAARLDAIRAAGGN